ncbi:MAG: RHS repeat-associated core domain-containing protein [Chloroflexota bacterium]
MTDASGTLTTQQRYLPFGEVRTDAGAITQTDFGYTFQRSLPEAGLMDYDARFYVPALGRFTQPDTLIPGAGNPQNLNRYSYVRNNPLRYADPTGHWIDEGGGFATNKKKNGRLKIVSGRRVGNSDGDGVFAPPPPPPLPPTEEPWRFSKDLEFGFHIGPTADIHVPYYDDDSYNGLPWVGSNDSDNNFWVRFNVSYDESIGITISDMKFANYYDKPTILSSVRFESEGKSTVSRDTGFEMPRGFGSAFSLPSPKKSFSGNSPLTITIEVGYYVDAGHGPFRIDPDYHIRLPSLPDLKSLLP